MATPVIRGPVVSGGRGRKRAALPAKGTGGRQQDYQQCASEPLGPHGAVVIDIGLLRLKIIQAGDKEDWGAKTRKPPCNPPDLNFEHHLGEIKTSAMCMIDSAYGSRAL